MITRNRGVKISSNQIKKKTDNYPGKCFFDNEELSLAATVNKESIDFLAKQVARVEKPRLDTAWNRRPSGPSIKTKGA